jgi:glycosyltransferase involved in cell wall biosynthesis
MKVSVMMITYNHERFIAHAIESVLAQKVNFDYEIVIGEDSSTDGTRAIIMDFQRRHPDRIVPLLRDQNIGMMRNLKATLAACRGRYVALLEGDDYWTRDDKLQRQVDFLDAHPDHAICCHRAEILNETDRGWNGVLPNRPPGSYAIEDLVESNWLMTCSVVYRWGSIGALPGWFVEKPMGDWPLHVLVARSGKIYLMDEVMAVYRVHSGGVWSSRTPINQLRETVRMLSTLDKHLGFKYTHTIRRTLAQSYFEMACYARHGRNRMQTAKDLVSCLRNGGWQLSASRRTLAALAAYALIGSWYKVFSRSDSVGHT